MKGNKLFMIIIGLLMVITIFLVIDSISLHNQVKDPVEDIENLQKEIDSLSYYFDTRIQYYEERQSRIDSLIILSNFDYESENESHWDSVNDCISEHEFDSIFSEFLRDLHKRSR